MTSTITYWIITLPPPPTTFSSQQVVPQCPSKNMTELGKRERGGKKKLPESLGSAPETWNSSKKLSMRWAHQVRSTMNNPSTNFALSTLPANGWQSFHTTRFMHFCSVRLTMTFNVPMRFNILQRSGQTCTATYQELRRTSFFSIHAMLLEFLQRLILPFITELQVEETLSWSQLVVSIRTPLGQDLSLSVMCSYKNYVASVIGPRHSQHPVCTRRCGQEWCGPKVLLSVLQLRFTFFWVVIDASHRFAGEYELSMVWAASF